MTTFASSIAPLSEPKTPLTADPAATGHPIADILTSPDWEWSEPMDLGPHVNSPLKELGGVLTDDELRIVFSSGGNLSEATRAEVDRPFGPAKRLGDTVVFQS